MDFRIPGLPHSVVKHAQSTSVRELIQKIENHSDRHALQQDLRQNKAYNPFSAESKKMIQEVGNIELFELLETDPKTQCTACLLYWNLGIVYCTCGHCLKKETVVRCWSTHNQRDTALVTSGYAVVRCWSNSNCDDPPAHSAAQGDAVVRCWSNSNCNDSWATHRDMKARCQQLVCRGAL